MSKQQEDEKKSYAVRIYANGLNYTHSIENEDDIKILEGILNKVRRGAGYAAATPVDEKFYCWHKEATGEDACNPQCESCKKVKLATPVKESKEDKSNEAIEDLAERLWNKWALKYEGNIRMTKDLFTLAIQDIIIPTPPTESNEAIEFLDQIRDYEKESGNKICYDERTSAELYKLFNEAGERKFTLDEMLNCWNAGFDRLWGNEFGVVPNKHPGMKEYFKEKFGIDLGERK